MKSTKTLIDDIAAKANVSRGTVSNALNNRKGVSQEKKALIIKIAEELGYAKKSDNEKKVIRFVIVKKDATVVSDSPFFSELIQGIEIASRQNGFQILINHIFLNKEKKTDIDEIVKESEIDGLIILGTEMDENDLGLFDDYRIPIVILDNNLNDQRFDFVRINNVDGANEIVNYMIEQGHKKIGLINSSAYINNFGERRNGYIDALFSSGIDYKKMQEYLVRPTMEGAYEDMKALLANHPEDDCTAYFAVNDLIALGAIKAFQESSIRTMDTTSIAGFDDLPFCEFYTPKLTTVVVDKAYMGSVAVRRLIDKISHNDERSQKISINTHLVIRDSVKQK